MRKAPETAFLQMIDFNSFSTFGDEHYIPQIFVANRLVFHVANWLEVLKIAFYLAYKNVEGKEFIDSQVGKKHPSVNRIFVSNSRRLYSNPCKFCSDLYVFPRDDEYNASLIRLILASKTFVSSVEHVDLIITII